MVRQSDNRNIRENPKSRSRTRSINQIYQELTDGSAMSMQTTNAKTEVKTENLKT